MGQLYKNTEAEIQGRPGHRHVPVVEQAREGRL